MKEYGVIEGGEQHAHLLFDKADEWVKEVVLLISAQLDAPKKGFDHMAYFGRHHQIYQGTIHSACLLSRSDLVSMLLSSGERADLKDQNGAAPIQLCAISGCVEAAQVLLGSANGAASLHTADPQYGLTALHLAVYSNSVEMIRLLCRHGGPVEAINKRGHSALYLAAQHDKPECAVALLQGGDPL